jgi:hypothetical protein
MRFSATPAFLATLLLGAATAHAQTAIATEGEPRVVDRRIDTRLGMLTGGNDLGDVTGPSSGLYVTAGYRSGSATLMVEYDYLHVGDGDSDATDRDGRMTRGGAMLRWLVADVAKPGAPVGLEFWAEGGGGLERVAWDHGGILYRPDLALGFGLDIDGRGWRESGRRQRHFGAFVAFRAVVARAPESTDPVMCEGPCSIATRPSRNDVGLYFLFGLHWGR